MKVYRRRGRNIRKVRNKAKRKRIIPTLKPRSRPANQTLPSFCLES